LASEHLYLQELNNGDNFGDKWRAGGLQAEKELKKVQMLVFVRTQKEAIPL